MKTKSWTMASATVIGFLLCAVTLVCADGEESSTGGEPTREELVAVAREIMHGARFCALVTLDDSGRPQARAMDPFAPEDDLVIWLATNPESRKVSQIRNDPRVALYYFDSGSSGYVTLLGDAHLVDDALEKSRRWKEGWEAFYPDREEGYLLIRVETRKLEVVSVQHGVTGDPETWTPFSVDFGDPKSTGLK